VDSSLWQAILWVHLVAMAFFLGGQLLLASAVVPALRGEEHREQLRAVARRFGSTQRHTP
jgi:putative copper export protein